MSGFGGLFGSLLGGSGANHENVGSLLGGAIQSAGGVQGLVDRANAAGLGSHVQSWIGDGSNLPVSPAEIEKIFPPAQMDQFAQAHGVPAGAVPALLAEFLPHAVDQATPTGDPQAADQTAAAQGGGFDFGGLAKRFLGGA